MQIVDLGEHGVLEVPDEASPEDIQRAANDVRIQSAAAESQRQLRKASIAGAGENVARSLDFLGAAGRVLKGAGEYTGRLAEDVIRGDVGIQGQPFIPRFRGQAELPGPKLGPVAQGTVEAAQTAPLIAGAMGLERLGVPPPLAFGSLTGSQAAAEGGDTTDIIKAGVVGAAIPESGALGRDAAAKLLNSAVEKGLLSAKRTVAQKAVESLASQGGMQLFMAGLDLPRYAALPPEKRADAIKESIAKNAAWLLMEVPGFVPGRPSQTQAQMEPMTRAASFLNDAVDNPATLKAVQDTVDNHVRMTMMPTRTGLSGMTGEKEMVKTGPDVLEPWRTPFIPLTERQPEIPAPIEGAPNAIQERSATPPVVGEAPGSSPEVGRQVRDTETPALPRPKEEGQAAPPHPPDETVAKPKSLRPALLVDGVPVTGIGRHKDIFEAENAKALSANDYDRSEALVLAQNDDSKHVFVDQDGNVLSRKEAAPIFKEITGKEPQRKGSLQSEDLIAAGLHPAVPEAPKPTLTPVPPTPIVPVQPRAPEPAPAPLPARPAGMEGRTSAPSAESVPAGTSAEMLAESGGTPVRSAAVLAQLVRTARANIKEWTRKAKSGGKRGAAYAAMVRREEQKLVDLRGEQSRLEKPTPKAETTPARTGDTGVTEDDGNLKLIVDAGKIPIFMPKGGTVRRYNSIMAKKAAGELLTAADKNFLNDNIPPNYEDHFGARGETARAAYAAAERAGIAGEIFAPVEKGNKIHMPDVLHSLKELSKGRLNYANGQELFDEIAGLAEAHRKRVSGEAAETQAAEEARQEQEYIVLTRDLDTKSKGTEPLAPEKLEVGYEFTLKGTKVKVTGIETDPDEDGRITAVTLSDGNKYGTHRVPIGEGRYELRMDVGSLDTSKATAAEAPTEDFGALPPEQEATIKAVSDPFAPGKKIRFKNNPQPWTILEETTDPRFPDERLFKVKNDRTGEVAETGQLGVEPISARAPEEKAKGPKRNLDAELIALGMDPDALPDKASKISAIKRARAKKGSLGEDGSDVQGRGPVELQSVEQLRDAVRSGKAGLNPEQAKLINAFLDSPMGKALDGVRFRIADTLEHGWQGSYFEGVVELARNSTPETGPHEFAHRLWELLPKEVRDQFESMRVAAINERLGRVGNAHQISILEDLREMPIAGGEDFADRGYDSGPGRELYHLASPEEFFTHSLSKAFREKVDAKGAGLITRMKDLVREFVAVLRKALGLTQSQDQLLRNVMAGRFDITPETGIAAEQNRRKQQGTGVEGPPRDEDMLNLAEYEKKIHSDYFDTEGRSKGSSREVPATPQGLRVGMWRVDNIKGIHGHEISQLRLLDPNTVGATERLVEENIEGRGWDAERYAEWLKENKPAPPIEVLENDGGRLIVVNGHRRLAAAKRAGKPVLAWVSPSMDVPPDETGKIWHYSGKEDRPIIKTGLTIEAWREGLAKRTQPLQGGFSSEGIPRPEGFPQFSLGGSEKKASLPPEEESAAREELAASQKEPKKRFRQIAGQKIGAQYVPENLRVKEDLVRNNIFSGTFAIVTPENTRKAQELFDRLTNPQTRGQAAAEMETLGGGPGAAGIVRNELWGYAVNMLQAKGDVSLFNAMRLRSAEFETRGDRSRDVVDYGVVGDSLAGLHLRVAREMVMQGLWRPIIKYTNAQLQAAGRVLGVGPDAYREILRAVNDISSKIDPNEWDNLILFGEDSAGDTLARLLEMAGPERKAAEEIVQAVPPQAVRAVPAAKRPGILETVYEWMKRDVQDSPEQRRQFTEGLSERLAREFLLTEEQANTIADQTWNRKVTLVSEKTKRMLDAELRMLDAQAEKTAEGFIKRWGQAEWLKRDTPNPIRDMIMDALKTPLPLDEQNILQTRTAFEKSLVEAGLAKPTAERLTMALWDQRRQDFINAQMRARQRAAQATSIVSLIESIKSSPYLTQKDPAWRLETAQRWFESNGLGREEAKQAAAMFDQQFTEAYARAAAKIAEQMIKNPSARTIPELITAIRAGLTDPTKEWSEEIAKRDGFRALTVEQHQKLAELERKHSQPDLSPEEQVAIVEEMMGVMRHAGDQSGHFMNTVAESFAASLLSGLRTLTLHIFQPLTATGVQLMVHSAFQPADFPSLCRATIDAFKTWKPAARYAWTHDAYSFSSEQMGFHTNELKRQFEIAQREWAAGQYAKAIPRFVVGYQQFAIRGLMTANQAGMRVVQRWKLALYGSMAMRKAGLGTKDISDLVDVAADERRAMYSQQLADGKSEADAAAIADHWTNDAILNFIERSTGNSGLAAQVAEASLYDSFSEVGRRGPGVQESEEGFLSRKLGVTRLMEFTAKMRGESGALSILNIMAVGFMNIPLRLTRYYAGWGPYGIIRYSVYKAMQGNTPLAARLKKSAGDADTFWKQSYKNDLQAKEHLREAIVGTGLMLAFGAWQHYKHTSDDDAEKRPFAMFVTGAGPENKTMRDSWTKRGYRPFSLHVIVDGKVRAAMPITRVGEIVAYPLGLAAAQDDLAWRRKHEEAIGRGKPEGMSREAIAAASTYYEIIGAQGVFQSFGHISQLGRGEAGVGGAVGRTLASTAAGITPFHGLMNSITGLIWGPVDRSSTEAAMMANFPVLNVLVNGRAINRFGDYVGDQTWFARMANTGIPIAFRVSDTPENKAMYQMVLDKGAAPPDLRRYIVEEKYGPLSQTEWNRFAKTSGDNLKGMVLANLPELQGLPPQAVHEFMVRAGESANAQAAATLNLEPIPQVSRSMGGSGASGGGVGAGAAASSGISLPQVPKISALGLPQAPLGTGRAAMAGGRSGTTSLPGSLGSSTPARALSPAGIGGVGARIGAGRLARGGAVSRRVSLKGRRATALGLVHGRLRARSGRPRRIRLARARRGRRLTFKG